MAFRASKQDLRRAEIERKAKASKWKRPDQRPAYSEDDSRLSVFVLMYDTEMKVHALGWFNFDTEKWSSVESDFDPNEGLFLWTELEVPEV